jgi:WD40 repeat protein
MMSTNANADLYSCGRLLQLVDLTGDFVNPDESKKITRFKLPVHCCCFSKDGKGLLVGSDDGLIKLCTVPKGSHSSKVGGLNVDTGNTSFR